jgi:hypothetical protein
MGHPDSRLAHKDPLLQAVARVHADVLRRRYPGTVWDVRPVDPPAEQPSRGATAATLSHHEES